MAPSPESSLNSIPGPFPVLDNCTELIFLDLSCNNLAGPIPLTFSPRDLPIGKLGVPGKIIVFNCRMNKLSGEIPSEFGLLQNLTELDLSGNQFSGEIPPDLGRLRLTSLNLSSNYLSGKIPGELENAAFYKSFLNNPRLCASTSSFGISICNKNTSNSSDSKLVRLAAFLGSIAGTLFTVVVLYILYCLRKKWKARKRLHSNWKFIKFHSLSFTVSDILTNLIDDNVVGSGGSGKVYLVTLRTGKQVAIKKILNHEKLDEKLEKQFEAEVGVLGKVWHSNIVKLVAFIASEDTKLLVYEYQENLSLDLWLHPKRRQGTARSPLWKILEWPTRLHIATGIAKGLCYLHHCCSPPIVHRDVKSSNVLLDSEMNAKIADFGLARELFKPEESNTVSAVAGSFGYIAPEYVSICKVNEKIDVYSFGVILLELVTGKVANDRSEDLCLVDWARKYIKDEKPITDALDAVIKKQEYLDEMQFVFKLGIVCTNKTPSSRPTMKEVEEMLQRQTSYADNINGSERDASPLIKSFNIHSGSK
ncbi:receptor-like protein kinase 5 isoform X2 [Ipomoea triloba]|uniref:receptor-like protein kinase 5 isoform X2 n=1 Tax=Ipomoea triloba TaxID=35885 RepID=UPI00125D4B8A|nr:receptor-like protein kinase 5 isoform X2 [Ipomoea triloba]